MLSPAKPIEPRNKVSFKIPASTKNRIEQLAVATRRTKTFVIEEAIDQYLALNEWQLSMNKYSNFLYFKLLQV